MRNPETQAMAENLIFIVQCNLAELDPSQEYTLKQMVEPEVWKIIKGRERSLGQLFRDAVEDGKINLVHVGDDNSNANLYKIKA